MCFTEFKEVVYLAYSYNFFSVIWSFCFVFVGVFLTVLGFTVNLLSVMKELYQLAEIGLFKVGGLYC